MTSEPDRSKPSPPKMSARELEQFLYSHFPDMRPGEIQVEGVGEMTARVRRRIDNQHLRPGGTVSGPTLMALADTAMYMALLAMIGPVALAVTSSLSIHFLRKPRRVDCIAEARLLKLGRNLAVGEVTIFSDGATEPVAHATVTYSIPRS
jgi:uncharacterized protein (TIGR00369 family)